MHPYNYTAYREVKCSRFLPRRCSPTSSKQRRRQVLEVNFFCGSYTLGDDWNTTIIISQLGFAHLCFHSYRGPFWTLALRLWITLKCSCFITSDNIFEIIGFDFHTFFLFTSNQHSIGLLLVGNGFSTVLACKPFARSITSVTTQRTTVIQLFRVSSINRTIVRR